MITWKHDKSGKLYHILHHGLAEVNLAPVVVYQRLEGGPIWVRPAEEFFDGRFRIVNTARKEPIVDITDPTLTHTTEFLNDR